MPKRPFHLWVVSAVFSSVCGRSALAFEALIRSTATPRATSTLPETKLKASAAVNGCRSNIPFERMFSVLVGKYPTSAIFGEFDRDNSNGKFSHLRTIKRWVSLIVQACLLICIHLGI
jgi:hypothetical protein